MKPIRLSLFSFINTKEHRTLIYITRNIVYILLVFVIMMSILESAKSLNSGNGIRFYINFIIDIIIILIVINDTFHIVSIGIIQICNVVLSMYILIAGSNISPYILNLNFLSRRSMYRTKSIVVLSVLFIITCSLWFLIGSYKLYAISVIHALISSIVLHIYAILMINQKIFISLLDRLFGA